MAHYLALTYTPDVDWYAPEQAEELADYRRFGKECDGDLRAAAVLAPTGTATTIRVVGARGGDVVVADGPYAETKEALTGYYVIEADDLDGAIKVAADIPAAWNGAVELRPILAWN